MSYVHEACFLLRRAQYVCVHIVCSVQKHMSKNVSLVQTIHGNLAAKHTIHTNIALFYSYPNTSCQLDRNEKSISRVVF